MEIRAVSNFPTPAMSSVAPQAIAAQAQQAQTQQEVMVSVKSDSIANINVTTKQGNEQTASQGDDKKSQLTRKEVEHVIEGLNDFMASMNTDIKFVLHQKMNELVVQVIDTKSHKILRQSPPKELLDSIARIRDFVGLLLDKKI